MADALGSERLDNQLHLIWQQILLTCQGGKWISEKTIIVQHNLKNL